MRNNIPSPSQLRERARNLLIRNKDIEAQNLAEKALELSNLVTGRIGEIHACVSSTDAQKARLPELFAVNSRIHGLLKQVRCGKIPPPRRVATLAGEIANSNQTGY